MWLTFWALVAAILISLCSPARAETTAEPAGCETTFECVDKAIQWWVRKAPRHPASDPVRRRRAVAALTGAAARYDIPWELLTAMAFRESSARYGQVGLNGELGLLQVHPGTAARHKCDREKDTGWVYCGARVLRYHADRCGSLRGGLTAYASRGQCTSARGSRLRSAVDRRYRLAARLKEAVNDERN